MTTTKPLTMGVIASSSKENERRLPIHVDHLHMLQKDTLHRMFFEKGYGLPFGFSDEEMLQFKIGGLKTREELIATCDIIVIAKPTPEDFPSWREGQILWGWPHVVQNQDITDVAIAKKMTFLAWEAMFLWRGPAEKPLRDLHIFHQNNEMAGYCSVMHGMGLHGTTGAYGPPKRAAVIGFGSTGIGAVEALKGLNIHDITLITQRPYHAITAPTVGLSHRQYFVEKDAQGRYRAMITSHSLGPDGGFVKKIVPMCEELKDYDIVCNCVLQDTDKPVMYTIGEEVENLKNGAVIIDISCDRGMGFDFARPTSFEHPSFMVGKRGNIMYYAVDHSPTYMWRSASWEISAAGVPYIDTIMAGPEAWGKNPVIKHSIEIRDGVIQNSKVFTFQNREAAYPHKMKG